MRNLRRWLKWVWSGVLSGTGAIHFFQWRLRSQGAIVVLLFHRVLDDADFQSTASRPGMILRRKTFQRLAAHAARALEIVDLSHARPGRSCRRLRCAFTFDDGWEDNCRIALPIARQHEIPLTIFLCPGLLEQRMPFWPERVASALKRSQLGVQETEIGTFIERLKTWTPDLREEVLAALEDTQDNSRYAETPDRTLSWREVVEMDRAGVRFGAHTQTHHLLTAIPERLVRDEVEGSKSVLEQFFGRACTLFAYPNGNHSPRTRQLLAEAGYSLAFTTERAPWTIASDPLAVPRINIAENDVVDPLGRFSPSLFGYSVIWKAWRGRREILSK